MKKTEILTKTLGHLFAGHAELTINKTTVRLRIFYGLETSFRDNVEVSEPCLRAQLILDEVVPRSGFSSRAQIMNWAEQCAERFFISAPAWLISEAKLFARGACRYSLNKVGVGTFSMKETCEAHLAETRTALQTAFGLAQAHNRIPLDKGTLEQFIRNALTSPEKLPAKIGQCYELVNEYLRDHYGEYASNSGRALRERCKRMDIDFRKLVEEARGNS